MSHQNIKGLKDLEKASKLFAKSLESLVPHLIKEADKMKDTLTDEQLDSLDSDVERVKHDLSEKTMELKSYMDKLSKEVSKL